MPMQPVTLRRWEVAACFLLFVASLVFATELSYRHIDKRVDQAERRILANRVSIHDLEVVNQRQDELRRQLVAARREADLKLCKETEAIKARIRQTVHLNKPQFKASLVQLGIDPTSAQGVALLAQAERNQEDTLARFKPRNCRALTSGP